MIVGKTWLHSLNCKNVYDFINSVTKYHGVYCLLSEKWVSEIMLLVQWLLENEVKVCWKVYDRDEKEFDSIHFG